MAEERAKMRADSGGLSNASDWPYAPHDAATVFNSARMMAESFGTPTTALSIMKELARRGYAPAKDWLKTNA